MADAAFRPNLGNASASNFFFRGSLPVTANHTFAKAEMTAQAAILAKAANLTLPSTFYIYILSLLQPLEIADALVEKNYFEAHPLEGQVSGALSDERLEGKTRLELG